MNEDEFEQCAARLEEHVGSMINHLDDLQPELSSLQRNISNEFHKINYLVDHYTQINLKFKKHADRQASLLAQGFALHDVE